MSQTSQADELLQAARQHQGCGQLRLAANLVDMVLEKYPQHGAALLLHTELAAQAGDVHAACVCLQRGMAATAAADIGSWLAWGELAQTLGLHDAAAQAWQQAQAAPPSTATEWNRLGVGLQEAGQTDAAKQAYQTALALAPDFAFAHNNRAALLQQAGRPDLALAHYQRAVHCDPHYAVAWKNYGAALQECGQYPQAQQAYLAAWQARPDYAEALAGLIHMRQHMADWTDIGRQAQQLLTALQADPVAVVAPFAWLAIDGQPRRQRDIAQRWARQYRVQALPARPAQAGQRIRLGYLGGDFYEHATSRLTAGLFAGHDRTAFEVWIYDHGPDDGSALRQRVLAGTDHYRAVGTLSQAELAQRIRADSIDILIDLKGWTRASRCEVLAARPAPVQVHYLAYPGSLGADWCDYLLADRQLVGDGELGHYHEAVVRLPDCYQINDGQRPIDAVPARTALGLPEAAVVFCCFNQHYKIGPAQFALWMQLLAAVPDSVLWLLDGPATTRQHLQDAASRLGIAPQRLHFAPLLPQARHLARLACADLALDTLPFNAHTTASDALWAGVPLLSCRGESFAGRVGASCLQAVGLPELICHSPTDYLALGIQLGRDRPALAALRAKLAQQRSRSPLFDTARSVRALERAYRAMWQRACQGLPPASFDVGD